MVSVHVGVFDLEDVAAAGGKAKVIGKISCLNRKVRKRKGKADNVATWRTEGVVERMWERCTWPLWSWRA